MKDCKHDFGWCVEKRVFIFIGDKKFYKGKEYVQFGWKGGNKIVVSCNAPDCRAIRNVYLKGKVVTWGKIKYRKEASE